MFSRLLAASSTLTTRRCAIAATCMQLPKARIQPLALLSQRLKDMTPQSSITIPIRSFSRLAEPAEYLHTGNVKDNRGAKKKRRRVGRGLGGGLGKTSGRGHKGWLARSSKSRPVPGYEGGQTGLLKAIPKLGFRPK
ncbi:hypothetical protein HDU97_001730 [Phlyctochytrium planicorne]|nr:hypothetical protein HDU97_001730 [Phlyctochytrium planicorne]